MAAETTADTQRQEIFEIAEAIAPTWERRRADIEAVCAPIRDWMVNVLSLRAGDTVLELAAGVGDTGFDAAEIVGDQGRLISTPRWWPRLAAVAPNGASPTSSTE